MMHRDRDHSVQFGAIGETGLLSRGDTPGPPQATFFAASSHKVRIGFAQQALNRLAVFGITATRADGKLGSLFVHWQASQIRRATPLAAFALVSGNTRANSSRRSAQRCDVPATRRQYIGQPAKRLGFHHMSVAIVDRFQSVTQRATGQTPGWWLAALDL